MTFFKQLETLYLKGPINNIYKPKIKVSKGSCEIEQSVNSDHFHAGGALHGSVLFKLMDDAAFFAANSIEKEKFVLTGTFQVKFQKPVIKGFLVAKGSYVERSGRKIIAKAHIEDDSGQLIASGKGVFIVSNILLSTLIHD